MKQKIAEFFILLMGFRKLLVMVLLFAIAIWFRLKGLMGGGDVVELLKGTTIAFFSANGIEHFTTMVKDYVTNRAPPVPPVGTQSTTVNVSSTPAPVVPEGDKEVDITGIES